MSGAAQATRAHADMRSPLDQLLARLGREPGVLVRVEATLNSVIFVLNAISDAIASIAGHRIYPSLVAPATPERVLNAIDRWRFAERAEGA